MREEEKKPTVFCRYCPNLDHNVVLLSRTLSAGTKENTCLCAHLCEKDKRLLCPHHDEPRWVYDHF